MIRKSRSLKFYAFGFSALLVGVSSCQEEVVSRLTLQDTADITEEALTDSYFQDLDDMAGIAIGAPSDTDYSGGRRSATVTIQDHRFNCEGIAVTVETDPASTAENPQGVLTVDFGAAGCSDLKGNVRKGKLIFIYSGKRYMPGSAIVTTTENYVINDIRLEGTRTLTNVSTSTTTAPRFRTVLAEGKAFFPGGATATRESDITWQWNRAENPLEDNLSIETTSVASGVARTGREYAVAVLEPLVYKRHCGIAVSGVKKYLIDGEKEVVVDYGEGTCDRDFTITVNGVVHEISL